MISFSHDFSQHSLQDYLDCHLRFRLRYLDQMDWPAAQTDDQLENELHQRKGVDFHRLVQQWVTGIDETVLEAGITDPQVQFWWQSFKTARERFPQQLQVGPDGFRQAEYTLTGNLQGYRLLAKLDLWLVEPEEKIWIFDWKTNRRPIPEAELPGRIQTRVYRYLAAFSGGRFAKTGYFPAELVEMIYWQTSVPGQLSRFPYSREQFTLDGEYLNGLMQEIRKKPLEQFQKTDDQRKCKFCNYRSYCDRGLLPGSLTELEQDGLEMEDFSDVEAIEY